MNYLTDFRIFDIDPRAAMNMSLLTGHLATHPTPVLTALVFEQIGYTAHQHTRNDDAAQATCEARVLGELHHLGYSRIDF